jgi:biopolymer transport protein ExbD
MGASALPSGDDSGDGDDGIVAEINVTPLTDVFLVLLIIFMVTTTIVQNEGKNIDLPEGTHSEETPQGVTVSVGQDGRIQVNERVVEHADLLSALEEAVAGAQEKIVVLRGDKNILFGEAVNILDLAQQAGAKGISIATQAVLMQKPFKGHFGHVAKGRVQHEKIRILNDILFGFTAPFAVVLKRGSKGFPVALDGVTSPYLGSRLAQRAKEVISVCAVLADCGQVDFKQSGVVFHQD